MNTESPLRRELRARLFWSARWLLGGSYYHRGNVEVVVRDGDSRRAGVLLTLRPMPGDEVYDGDIGPEQGERMATLAVQLLAALLSADGLAIVRHIQKRQPVTAKAIVIGTGIDRTKLYTLLTDLRDRGLIRDTPDGYVIANKELLDMLPCNPIEVAGAA